MIAHRRIGRAVTGVPVITESTPRFRNANRRTPCLCDEAPIASPETLAAPGPIAADGGVTDSITRKIVGARKWPNRGMGHAANRAVAAFPGGARR